MSQISKKRSPWCSALICLALAIGLARPADAAEPFLEFLHALQDRGYGALAVEYLKQISQRSDLPDEIRQTLDLELATSLQKETTETTHTKEMARAFDEAQQHLAKFLQEHPDHPQAAAAFATYGDIAAGRGKNLLQSALGTKDDERRGALMLEARGEFEKARPRYQESIKMYAALLADQPAASTDEDEEEGPRARGRTRRRRDPKVEQAAANRARQLAVRFKAASLDYQIARTDPAAPERKAALQAAAKEFDDIYQYRRSKRSGMVAHVWQGRALFEMGDFESALEIFDEVLAIVPDTPEEFKEESTEALELYNDVEQARLTILAKQGKTEELVAEAEDWMKKFQAVRRMAGTEGVALELAKAQLAQAEALNGAAKRKALQGVRSALAKLAAVESPYKQEAILLRKHILPDTSDNTEIKDFDEAIALGEAAYASNDWNEAITAYTKAVELQSGSKDREAVLKARLQLARALWAAGKADEALKKAEELARDKNNPDRAAAEIAMRAALRVYQTAEDKASAHEHLLKLSQFIVERWPQSVEADEARMALGKVAMMNDEFDKAIGIFEAVNALSERHPAALHLAGMAHWRVYLKEKAKPEESRNQDQMATHRAKAVEELRASLQAQRAAKGADPALPRELIETQVLLADTEKDAGNLDEASRMLDPLVDFIATQPAEPRDPLLTYALEDAVKTAVKRKNAGDAAAAANALMDRGDDSANVNNALLGYAMLLRDVWKSPSAADATPQVAAPDGAGANGQGPNRAAGGSALSSFDAKAQLQRVLKHLAGRQGLKSDALAYIGETLGELGLSDAARELYQSVLDRIGQAANLSPADFKLRMRARAKLLSLLRAEGKYDEALEQVESLIKDARQPPHEKAFPLELMLEKGYILHDAKRYDQALGQWSALRKAMRNVPKRPAEYYDVVYRAAECLVALAEQEDGKKKEGKEKKKEKYLQAKKLLHAEVVVSPELSGPEMAKKYKELQDKIDKEQPKEKTKAKPKQAKKAS
jgi:tetratricopeptide (TPR) repeat protein